MRQRPSHSRFVMALALTALFAFSGPGVVVAHAEADLAPSADELFGAGGGAPAQFAPSGPAVACDPTLAQSVVVRRRLAAARMAELMDGNGSGRALRNGQGYAPQRDPAAQMRRIEAEVAALRAADRH